MRNCCVLIYDFNRGLEVGGAGEKGKGRGKRKENYSRVLGTTRGGEKVGESAQPLRYLYTNARSTGSLST